ncbi:hypothetical protein M422DRAFT_244734 [Sphaerobolus stellatus SS14]|nr:hypothetical protein M422DRAFT_244734 [Sphaerobolus stellatus SS14]
MSPPASSSNAADLLLHFRDQQAKREGPRVELGTIPGACFVFHPKGCDRCSEYIEHLLKDMEQSPSKFSFTRDETLDHLQEAWPKLRQYITNLGDEHNAFEKELAEEKSNNDRLQEEIDDLLDKVKLMETQIVSLQPLQQSSDQSMMVISPTDTYSSDVGPHPLASPEKWTYSRKRTPTKSLVTPHVEYLGGLVYQPYERPNAVRDDYEGYFLKEELDITAWLSKTVSDIPRTVFMDRMKTVFGSCINFDTVYSEFDTNSLILHSQTTRWITDSSTPVRVGSQIKKGLKRIHRPKNLEQIYTQIIPYMERDGEKWPYSAAGSERTAYMQIHQHAPAQNKGKKSLTGSIQSKHLAHAPQLAKAGESSWQRLNTELDAYSQAREPVLPYDEEPLRGVSDVEMSTPVTTGARSTLPDESAMSLDHELDDLYI